MYSYNPYYGTYLSHFGVKGMKWGVRKDRVRSNKNKKKTKTYKKETAIRKGHAESALSNFDNYSTQELREVRERAFLKRDLESISKPKKGAQQVQKILNTSNTTIKGITDLATGIAGIAALHYILKTTGAKPIVSGAVNNIVGKKTKAASVLEEKLLRGVL